MPTLQGLMNRAEACRIQTWCIWDRAIRNTGTEKPSKESGASSEEHTKFQGKGDDRAHQPLRRAGVVLAVLLFLL